MFEDNPGKWTNEFFDEMRSIGEAYGDQVVDAIFEDGDVAKVNAVLNSLIKNDQLVPEDLPQVVHDYFENTAILPDWADMDLINQGEELFVNYSLMAFSILGCASLPVCYSGAIGAKVLGITGELEDHVNRRVIETFFMVVYVMSEGGLAKGGRGIRAAQKVRLMHAAIRHLILTDFTHPTIAESPLANMASTLADVLGLQTWNLKKDGYPINQETMGFTYLTFSYVILRSMQIMKIKLSKAEKDAYFHCWNVVGHIMGVDERFYCNNMEDAEKLWNLVYPRLRASSPEGIELTRVLMNYMGEQIKSSAPFGSILPYKQIPRWLTRELVGRETAKIIGIRWHLGDFLGMAVTYVIMFFLGWFESKTYSGKAFGHRVAEWVFRKLIKAEFERIGERPEFEIPDHLQELQ